MAKKAEVLDKETVKLRDLIAKYRRNHAELVEQNLAYVTARAEEGLGSKAIGRLGVLTEVQAQTSMKLKIHGRVPKIKRPMSDAEIVKLAADVKDLGARVDVLLTDYVKRRHLDGGMPRGTLMRILGVGTARFQTALLRANGEPPKEVFKRPKEEPRARSLPNRFYKPDWAAYGIG